MYKDQSVISKLGFFRYFVVFFVLLIFSSMGNVSSVINKQSSQIHLVSQLESTEFLTYENSALGIKMQYPSDWRKTFDSNLGTDNLSGGTEKLSVHFISPQQSVDMKKADVLLTIQAFSPFEIQSQLRDIVEKENLADEILHDCDVMKPMAITIADIPAFKTLSTCTIMDKHIEFTDIRAINNNKLYSFIFGTGVAEYPTYLPIVQKMINSIEFIK
jgi:hypothetical protein